MDVRRLRTPAMNHAQSKTAFLAVIFLTAFGGILYYWLFPHHHDDTILGERAIGSSEAIQIATHYLKAHRPALDISRRAPVAIFRSDAVRFPPNQNAPFTRIGAWTVSFGIPSPPAYGRPVLTCSLMIDTSGHILFPPVTSSP